MTTAEYLGWAQQLLTDLGLMGYITALAVVVLAIMAFNMISRK